MGEGRWGGGGGEEQMTGGGGLLAINTKLHPKSFST